mmetsp:Transcript_17136/g.41568  ORF Transcript_17136/g.41568 Transcript_17136/m.41568 type:complete len:96 (-) Transcript_17136:1741-2028(-)
MFSTSNYFVLCITLNKTGYHTVGSQENTRRFPVDGCGKESFLACKYNLKGVLLSSLVEGEERSLHPTLYSESPMIPFPFMYAQWILNWCVRPDIG